MDTSGPDFWRSAARDAGTKTAQPSPAPVAQAGGSPPSGGGGRGVGEARATFARRVPICHRVPRLPSEGKIQRDEKGPFVVIGYDAAAIEHVRRKLPGQLADLLKELEETRP